MEFPKHAAGLYLEHNTYKDVYDTIDQGIATEDERFPDSWLPGEREKARETGEIWTLQWYPHTPVGFARLAAATLETLLEAAATVSY